MVFNSPLTSLHVRAYRRSVSLLSPPLRHAAAFLGQARRVFYRSEHHHSLIKSRSKAGAGRCFLTYRAGSEGFSVRRDARGAGGAGESSEGSMAQAQQDVFLYLPTIFEDKKMSGC